MENLIRSLELEVEIRELKALGLTDEEILGFVDFYQDTWIYVDNNPAIN